MVQGTFEKRYAGLNAAQKKAVDTIDGPVLVVAGPGSGKTELLSLRVANILKKTDTSPGTILCLTFTDSAAINMRKRLFGLIGEAAFRVAIHTFHSFATRIIDRYPHFFFDGAEFHPADDVVQIETLRKVFEELPHDHPLRSFHPEQGFVYLYDVKKRIDELKRAGISPRDFGLILDANETEFDALEKALKPLFDRVSKKELATYRGILSTLATISTAPDSLSYKVRQSLGQALDLAEKTESTTPLSDWKKTWIKKDEQGNNVWRDRTYAEKLRGTKDIFELYEKELYTKGYFDFGDMIMRVIQGLETIPELRMELEETFQYILLDEFQDTNGAQMRLVKLITSADVHEGRPNVLAVGDDDQAVYKFQGAELDNIMAFKDMYLDPVIIPLGDNYRSTKGILDIAEKIVSFNNHRLVTLMPDITKTLKQANKELPPGALKKAILTTPLHQMKFVSDEIKTLITQGVSPAEIAVIARGHEELKALVPFLHDRGIPVSYEKQRNVLHEEHVRELVTIVRYIHSRGGALPFSCDYLLPEILRYPFWGIIEKDIWVLARHAQDTQVSWTEALTSVPHDTLRSIGDFFGLLATKSQSETAEYILDNLIGTLSVAVEESDDESASLPHRIDFKSPFRTYYFSDERLKTHKAEYLSFLSSLRTFIEALREYKSGAPLSLADIVEFVDIREKNKLPLLDNSPFAQAEAAVTLTTAHKAKGQEFGTVFILSCQDDVWAGSASRNKLPFPLNMPLTPATDSLSDFVRVFFVAITRARHTLYVTGYEREESGKATLPLRFLGSLEGKTGVIDLMEDVTPANTDHIETLELARKHMSSIPHVQDERVLFESVLENYHMSVTHLSNFLDVTRGGPRYFFEQNLLYFPQAKIPSGSFGTAIHEALRHTHVHLKHEGVFPNQKTIDMWFTTCLRKERLSPADEKHYTAKGIDVLKTYVKARKESIKDTDEVEVNFKHEGVVVEGARIAGKIDKIVTTPDGITVIDYKTGQSVSDWEGSSKQESLKLYKYRRQLLFYKILVEQSLRFKGKTVTKGIIDFVEPVNGTVGMLETGFTADEIDRLSRLIGIVYKKITTLDFPDVSSYSKDQAGIEQFESDLIAGSI